MIVTEVTIAREMVAKLLNLPEDAEVVGFSEGYTRELLVRICSVREPTDITIGSVDDIKDIGDAYRGIGIPVSDKGPVYPSLSDEIDDEDD